ncbi:hypothetical protein GGX14DRAFT_577421 [Mycena pura]|uniref:C2H2-type domain-containing protein n=1 Tax=Mycena pura TaxID=153505 RepID=A0AAD6URQ0_9AGAR|nr:hypothetical protein GGX14DRAFT_577421 [Mycena pura]
MAYCDRCERYFNGYHSLHQHEQNSANHNICNDCGTDFATWTGLKEHYVQSARHHYCQRCNRHFDHSDDLETHYEDAHHYCADCGRFFQNAHGLHEHYRQSERHHYCADCQRQFLSASNLNAHLNSSTHRPKSVPCPGQGCGQSFVSAAALILHLESGRCKSGASRQFVNRYVREHDTRNIITDPARMLTAGTQDAVSYIATGAAWNGRAYECYLCHAGFGTLAALNQHLASPRHEDEMYVCPLSTCRQRFRALSALWQHVESEQCGVTKFRVVQNAMQELVGSMQRGRLTYY